MSSKLQNKLLQYSPEPPPGAWDEISAALDHIYQNSFADKLYQYQQNPNTDVWEKIEHQIDTAKPAKVIPFYQRYRRAIRYSGATAALIFLAVVTTLLISKKTVSEVPTETVLNNAQTSTKINTNSSSNSEERIDYSATAQSIPEKTSKPHEKGLARLISKLKPEQISASLPSPVSFLFPDNIQRKGEIKVDEFTDRYMVYSDGDGNAVRLPKKIFDAVACPLNDIPCHDRIKQLQQKLASSDFTPDFTGIIEILNNLRENQ
jgi:hypothetical protein